MTGLRIFVPRGGGLGDARLQMRLLHITGTHEKWTDVPTIYEDPDDEIVECPVQLGERHMEGDGGRCCLVCLGEGSGRRGDIRRRLEHLQERNP